ncbi:XrtA/PEP-CTERM system exopolysaccharide export protein [Humitalea sp. 24SJ18S-53]|uniref:XrtA/PEP-CTERM system exopolysaccharide export protein n=1 Tax=Humitalea sp. 24SJ18S-53 TaxID=3422307 RepID=UPI003D6754B9
MALSGALAACAGPGATPVAAPVTTADPVAVADPANGAAPDYVLGPGDTVTVFVYRAPELSAADLPIRPDGRLTLPLAPDVVAAGATPTELAKRIEERLRAYVIEPNVTVMVRSFQGPPERQIRVIGEAAMPMAMPYREGMTVMDVMIGARGMTRYAAGNRASIIRREGGTSAAIPVRLGDLMRGGDVTQDIALRPGDTLVIPQGWF